MSNIKVVNPRGLVQPTGYNHGASVPLDGQLLFISGQIGWNPDGKLVSGFVGQVGQALSNLLSVVAEAGGGSESVAKLTIFVTDQAEYTKARKEIGEAYRRCMGHHYPAMSLVEVKGFLDSGARGDIEGVALIP